MIKAKVAIRVLVARLFSSQSELFENFSDCSDWLDKSRSSKKPLLFWSCKQANHVNRLMISLFAWSKPKWLFWKAGFYSANQSNQKSFQKALIGWKKADLPKKPLLFWSCKQAISKCVNSLFTWSKQKLLFWRAGLFLANQSFLKTFQTALIDRIKAGPLKSHFYFDHVNRLYMCIKSHIYTFFIRTIL